jgi:hypothetical protein
MASLLAALVAAAPFSMASSAADQKAPSAAGAANGAAQALGGSDAWTAYSFKDKTGRVCYLVGKAAKSEPLNAKRRPPTALVTHRPDEKIYNVVSFVQGYPLKQGSQVTVEIGSTRYELFTKDDSAWASTSDLDKTITETLAKGKQVVVTGTSQRGTVTTDTYELAGFAKTLALIDKACDVNR